MLNSPDSRSFAPLYTGQSPFLKANRWYVQALWNTSQNCRIESTEDILDKRGNKLWASNQPIVPDLLVKLADRELMKPIELCVRAKDPVSEAAIEAHLLEVCDQFPALKLIIQPHFGAVHELLSKWAPNPQQLLSFSVLHHGGVDHLSHAVAVAGFAFALADEMKATPQRKQNLLLAGLLHDMGQLYFEPTDDPHVDPESEWEHPVVGALSAIEMTHCSAEVAKLILNSHERINGLGFPKRTPEAELSIDARILLFAEAMVPHLTLPKSNVWRASVAARVINGEFDSVMVNWLVSQTQRYAKSLDGRLAEFKPTGDVGAQLRDLHGVLARTTIMLAMPIGETDEVCVEVAHWRDLVAPLLSSLRSTGVEDALALGGNLELHSDIEAIELHALWVDLHHRLARIQRWIQDKARSQREFAQSILVRDLLRIYQSVLAKGE